MFGEYCIKTMDRRKAEARSQLEKLKAECAITLELLHKLISESSNHVSELEQLDSKDSHSRVLYSKYFLAVSQFQHSSHQKLLELNVDLEEHLLEGNPQHLVNCTTGNSSSSLNVREFECNVVSLTSLLENGPPLVRQNSSTSNNSAGATSNLDNNSTLSVSPNEIHDNPECLDGVTLSPKQPDGTNEHTNNEYETFVSPMLNKKSPSSSTLLNEANIKIDSASELNDTASSEYLQCESSKGPLKSDESLDSSDDSLYEDPDFIDFSKQQTESETEPIASVKITEKLKQLPLISLEEKCLQSLPKAPMPDLSLKPTTWWKTLKTINKSSTESDLAESATLNQKSRKSRTTSEVDQSRENQTLDLSVKDERFATEICEVKDRAQAKVSSSESDLAESATLNQKSRKSRTTIEVDQSLEKPKLDVSVKGERFATEICEIKDRAPPKVGAICMIGYIKSPSEFYIQVADKNSPLLDLWSAQLAEIYDNSYSPFASKADAMEALGRFCCVQYDYFWYRAEILDWKLNSVDGEEDIVLAQLADYGNVDSLSYHQLRPLPKGFCHVPKMAQLCHLAYLKPPGSTRQHRRREWTKESLNGFFEICGDLDSTCFQVTYIMTVTERKSFEVDLIKLNQDGDMDEDSVGQILIDNGFAVEVIDHAKEVVKNRAMIDQIRAAHGLQGITGDMSKEEILDRYFQQNIEAEAANINEAVMHYNPRDEAQTCRNLRPDGTCYKGSRCKLRHVPLKDGFTMDREAVYQEAFVDAPLPRINDEIVVRISHIDTIQCFYAQVQPEASQHSFAPTINNLIKTMNSWDMTKMYKKLRHPPCPNQLVIAKHWNTYWYRAQVRHVQIPENNDEITTEVYFVDFGDKFTVPISQLREILTDFLHIPFQAVECRLFNVKHKEGQDASEETRYFESLYLGETLRAKVIACPGHLEVLLKNKSGEDIGLQLIENGFGELNTMHHFPAENELILID